MEVFCDFVNFFLKMSRIYSCCNLSHIILASHSSNRFLHSSIFNFLCSLSPASIFNFASIFLLLSSPPRYSITCTPIQSIRRCKNQSSDLMSTSSTIPPYEFTASSTSSSPSSPLLGGGFVSVQASSESRNSTVSGLKWVPSLSAYSHSCSQAPVHLRQNHSSTI